MQRAQQLLAHVAPTPQQCDLIAQSTHGSQGLLQGQVAIVTGSGQGIGAATAKLFASEVPGVFLPVIDFVKGAKVVVSDLDEGEIRAAGGEAIHVAGDVTDPAFPDKIIKATITKFGKLNILVNNAGYTWDGVIHKTTDQQWEAMFKVHCTAPFRLIRAATPYLRDASKKELEEGREPENRVVINVSSTSGIHGNAGQINYSTAKMGVVGMTKTVAKEWGPFGVRCNCIAFGYIDTRLTQSKALNESIEVDGKKIALGIPDQGRATLAKTIPLGRSGRPLEAAGAALMLASSHSAYITGHTLEVTGGLGI